MNAKQANKIPITSYLKSKGIEAKYATTHHSMYQAPYRKDDHPSLKVSHRENLWIDYGTHDGGTLIDLVLKIFPQLNVSEAIREIEQTIQLLFSFHQQKDAGRQTDASNIKNETSEIRATTSKDKHQISKVKHGTSKHHHQESNLRYQISKGNHKKSDIKHQAISIREIESLGMNPAITGYLHSRGIGLQTVLPYCKEIYYSVGERHYFGIGHKNTKGWSIRNKYWKGCTGQGFSWYQNEQEQKEQLNVFEGIFDMLSYLELKDRRPDKTDILILNSLINLRKAIPIIQSYRIVRLFLDHDAPGRAATKKIIREVPEAVDASAFYHTSKDLNEYYLLKHKEQLMKNQDQRIMDLQKRKKNK